MFKEPETESILRVYHAVISTSVCCVGNVFNRSAGRYGGTNPKVTGSLVLRSTIEEVKPSGTVVWTSTALFCQAVASHTLGTFVCLVARDQNWQRSTRRIALHE